MDDSPDLALLEQGCHFDPHRFLGLHDDVIRIWRPGAEKIHLEVLGRTEEAERVSESGLFVFKPKKKGGPLAYRIYHQNGLLAHDPYAFSPTVGELDLFLFNKGEHYELYRVLGANVREQGGAKGVAFAVWAPNARSVSLIADFNQWDGRLFPLRSLGVSGVWELFVPGVEEGARYKFEIRTQEGYLRIKSDPMASYAEMRPLTASVVFDINRYEWKDRAWMEARERQHLDLPMAIYEVHLGSWRNYGTLFPNYRQIAHDLASYCLEMHFTHVELMPVMEHPLDESWGYQVTGFFAATSRFGTPADFQYFVDHLHERGIGVLLDWVPAHFPTDDYSLNRFDGTALYEHEDPRKGMHPHWQTAIFNYGRKEVTNFLIASALFWLEAMHIDGLRVDAVASLIYLDYGRKAGEWIPNPDGSNFNIEAIEFLKHLNSAVHQRNPGVLMVAEESSSFQGVTHPLNQGGLGFDLKWNMGWMNDTLAYFSKDPVYRKHHQGDLTFSLLYAFSERFLSVLSHDEVVHGKNSLLAKMPGPDWQKFAGLRLLYSYMICHVGKKLLFMGGEIAQWSEWNCQSQLDWYLLQYAPHEGMQRMVREINGLYLTHPALWGRDFNSEGFEWVEFSDAEQSVLSFLRKSEKETLFCVHNFTPEWRPNYWIHLSGVKKMEEIFNSDRGYYGGSNQLNQQIPIAKDGVEIVLAPLATMIFRVQFHA